MHKKLLQERQKIIVDIDELEFLKFRFKVDVKIVSEASQFIKELLFQLKDISVPDWTDWTLRCIDWKIVIQLFYQSIEI